MVFLNLGWDTIRSAIKWPINSEKIVHVQLPLKILWKKVEGWKSKKSLKTFVMFKCCLKSNPLFDLWENHMMWEKNDYSFGGKYWFGLIPGFIYKSKLVKSKMSDFLVSSHLCLPFPNPSREWLETWHIVYMWAITQHTVTIRFWLIPFMPKIISCRIAYVWNENIVCLSP